MRDAWSAKGSRRATTQELVGEMLFDMDTRFGKQADRPDADADADMEQQMIAWAHEHNARLARKR